MDVGNKFLKWSRKSRLSTLVSIGLGVLAFAAAQWHSEAVAKHEILGKAVYDPSSGSYFEVIRNRDRGKLGQWKIVRAFVNKRI